MERDNLRSIEYLAERVSRTMLAMRDVIDDSLLKSRGVTVDIGYAARETKPDWPLVRPKMLHVVMEYQFSFLSGKVG